MPNQNKDKIDYIFKTCVAVAITLAGFFCNRLLNELDEARKDIRELEISVSEIKGLLKVHTTSNNTEGLRAME